MDYPRAWQIARDTPVEVHDVLCSYVQTEGAVLCDCHVLSDHPESDTPTAPPVEVWTEGEIVEVADFDEAKALMKEAVKEEAAWADQMEQEMAEVPSPSAEVAVVEPPQVESYPEGIDPPVDPLDIPDHYDLPMHGSILTCPKCSVESTNEDNKVKGLRTHYHPQGILHAPCGKRFGWPDIQNLGEHLCRVCEKCGYGWPEQVAHGTA